jgi:uncharacterized protein YndB with AHSA1/START domain
VGAYGIVCGKSEVGVVVQQTEPAIVVTRTITVARQPADVFATMTNPRILSRWLSSVFDAESHDRKPVVEGSEVWCLVKLHGQRMRVEGKWVVYDPPHRGTFATMLSPLKAQMTITCTPATEGTLAQIDITLGKGVFFGLTPSFVGGLIGRMLEYDLQTLKTIMEPPVSNIRF